jgi:hypothetical protein
MQENALIEPIELDDAELDLVTGGVLVTGGLVNITLDNISILNNNNVPITIKDLANNNNVSVGAIIQLLGGGAAILQHQAQA